MEHVLGVVLGFHFGEPPVGVIAVGLADAARVVREMTRDLRAGREFYVSDEHQELVLAVREFAELMDKNARRSAAPAGLNRAARRAKKKRRR